MRDLIEHDVWECIHAEGTYERHVKLMPSIPSYKVHLDPRSALLLRCQLHSWLGELRGIKRHPIKEGAHCTHAEPC